LNQAAKIAFLVLIGVENNGFVKQTNTRLDIL